MLNRGFHIFRGTPEARSKLFPVYDSHSLKNQAKRAIITAFAWDFAIIRNRSPLQRQGPISSIGPCFFFPGKSLFLSFENNSKGQNRSVAILAILSFQVLNYLQFDRPLVATNVNCVGLTPIVFPSNSVKCVGLTPSLFLQPISN